MRSTNKNNQYGEILRLLRILKCCKQETVAYILGIKQQAVSRLEKSKAISHKKFNKIVALLDFSKDDIEAVKKFLPPPQ